MATAFHVLTNGLTECINNTIADRFAMYVDFKHKTWAVILAYATFPYNTTVQEATKRVTFKLFHGRSPTLTLDVMLLNVSGEDNLDVARYLQDAI